MSSIVPPPPESGLKQVIVVATDFTAASSVAMQTALKLSDGEQSELHIVHCIGATGGLSKAAKTVKQDAKIDELAGRLRRHIGEEISRLDTEPRQHILTHVLPGEVAEAILQLTVDVQADMLIVGTHENETKRRWLTSSIEEALTRRAHCPVLVARPTTYQDVGSSDSMLPPCPDCVAIREKTNREQFWCDLHARPHVGTHVQEGSATGRGGSHPASFTIPYK